ncbi:TPA: IS200/IS605 family transposase [Escherichia coli]|nr:IS200/IS605 family transposase [Escherichia coli]
MILWSVKKETDIRRGRHCVFLMHVHLVFVTKYRRQIFDHDATEKLRTYFSKVSDHVHLLINYPPKLAISSLVNSLKGVSGRLLRRDRPDIAVRYYYKGVLWSPGYFASSCGGAPISAIRQYIEQQQTPGQVENRAVYPRPEGRGFTAHRINQAKRMLVDQIISPKRSNINIHLKWVDIWLKNIVFLPFIQ